MTPRRRGSRSSPSPSSSGDDSSSSSITDYIPNYLKRLVLPYYGDFCYSPCYHPKFLVQLMAEGFLPMATRSHLLPKLHQQRCVVRLSSSDEATTTGTSCSSQLHTHKSTRKKMKKFTIALNSNFESVVHGCHQQHGSTCWLYPELTESFREIYQATCIDSPMQATVERKKTGKSSSSSSSSSGCLVPVRLYCVEVYDETSDALVAGELGYAVGSVYTSLTGFSKVDSAGSVQLAALGCLLQQNGFTLWDLGMDMNYKRDLGATLMPRPEFVEHIHRSREKGHVMLPRLETSVNCKVIYEQNLATAAPSATANGTARPSQPSAPHRDPATIRSVDRKVVGSDLKMPPALSTAVGCRVSRKALVPSASTRPAHPAPRRSDSQQNHQAKKRRGRRRGKPMLARLS
jgi:Leu/Phe-tRNA-protein transferase